MFNELTKFVMLVTLLIFVSLGMIVLIANDGRLVDVVAIDVDNVGRMLDDFLGKVGVRPFVDDFPFVGAGVEDLDFSCVDFELKP